MSKANRRTVLVLAVLALTVASGCGEAPASADADPTTTRDTYDLSPTSPPTTPATTPPPSTTTRTSPTPTATTTLAVEGQVRLRARVPPIRPGERANLTIRAKNVTNIYFGNVSGEDPIEFDTANATFSPPVSGIFESYPPVWNWETGAANATVVVPVYAEPRAEGTYRYSIYANGGGQKRDAAVFAVVVEDEGSDDETSGRDEDG